MGKSLRWRNGYAGGGGRREASSLRTRGAQNCGIVANDNLMCAHITENGVEPVGCLIRCEKGRDGGRCSAG